MGEPTSAAARRSASQAAGRGAGEPGPPEHVLQGPCRCGHDGQSRRADRGGDLAAHPVTGQLVAGPEHPEPAVVLLASLLVRLHHGRG